ncbi:MAG: hypothetical protein AAI978_00860 [Candidatus Hodgkinia cicadicola]
MLERCGLSLQIMCLSWYRVLAVSLRRKLERWNNTLAVSLAPTALWENDSARSWPSKCVCFNGKAWSKHVKLVLAHRNSKFCVEFNKSKHVGVFPEHAVHWAWARAHIQHHKWTQALVLFSYSSAWINELGANVYTTNVDVDARAINKAKANAELSQHRRACWVKADAFEFLKQCIAKGTNYDVIMADPPGTGWVRGRRCDLTYRLAELVTLIDAVMGQHGLACLGLYSNRYNELSVHELVKHIVINAKTIDSGNVLIRECANNVLGARVMCARFVRWSK